MTSAGPVSLAQTIQALNLSVVTGEDHLAAELQGALLGDLLSYVMANGKPGWLWITIQTHPNVVAVAALARLAGIVIAAGFEPEEDTVARAEEEGLPLLTSSESAYVLVGRLWDLGVR